MIRNLLPLGLLALSAGASAAIIESGTVNIAIPNTSTGLYLNVIDGTTFTGPGVFPTLGGPGANYDINLFGSTTFSFFSPGTAGQSAPTVPAASRGYVAATSTSPTANLALGTVIGGSSTYNTGSPSASLVATGSTAYFGFRFRNEGADLTVATDDTVQYGYAEIILTNGAPGTLVRYAYESTPLTAITVATGAPVPEPATMAALGLGAVALLRRRRKA